jgi:cyclase
MDDIKKIVPCLDFKNGRVVKGKQFISLADAGDPEEFAAFYESEGADELAFLDISATLEHRATLIDAVKRVAGRIRIPLTVGGGIGSVEDAGRIFNAGASKVSVNTAAVKNPALISDLAKEFGSERVVVAIDAKRVHKTVDYSFGKSGWKVYINGGTKDSGIDAVEWARRAYAFGAGELLVTSVDRDGGKDGYDIFLIRAVSDAAHIPVTASGGAGCKEDFLLALTEGNASAALAASLFHFREIRIGELKRYLKESGVNVKI